MHGLQVALPTLITTGIPESFLIEMMPLPLSPSLTQGKFSLLPHDVRKTEPAKIANKTKLDKVLFLIFGLFQFQ
jgi:hypothetical protein